MPTLERFGVSMEDELLARFDSLIEERGYRSRSEAIRDLVRQELVKEQWSDPEAEVVGTLTIVYEHHEHELSNVLAELQHQYHEHILCSTHIHLDAHNCLEVIILQGRGSRLKYIANTLISTRGVKHGQMVCTTTGKEVS
ncbi:MAG: nickel-responsive transcriptional regulator NikR [Armatimonadetes bacterium]|nr:nickel-responsive transcriptional regulator NikR [Armatimonadota bacterium]